MKTTPSVKFTKKELKIMSNPVLEDKAYAKWWKTAQKAMADYGPTDAVKLVKKYR